MKYTVNLRVTTRGYVVAEPYEVHAGSQKSAEAVAAALAMDKHGRNNITEISVISSAEVKSHESA